MTGAVAVRAGFTVFAALLGAFSAQAAEGSTGWPPVGALLALGWDRAENVRDAARRVAVLQRDKGPKAVYQSIDECYKTQSRSAIYSEGLEACITQDYLESMALADRHSKLSPAVLAELGGPTPLAILDAMRHRVNAATKSYPISFPFVSEVIKLIDQQGVPVYLSIAFPDAPPPKAAE